MDQAVILATLDQGLGHDLTALRDVEAGKDVIGKDTELHVAARGVALEVRIAIHPGRKKELIHIPREGHVPDLQALSIEGQSLVLLLEMGQVLVPIPEVSLAPIPGILNHLLLEGNLLHRLWGKAHHQLEIILEARVLLSAGPIPVPGARLVHPVNQTKYHRTKRMKRM